MPQLQKRLSSLRCLLRAARSQLQDIKTKHFTSTPWRMNRYVSRLMTMWEAVQVELQGRHSLQRFKDLLAHAKASSTIRNAAIILLPPLSTLFVLLLLDALPMKSPYLGLAQQTPWFFFLCIVCVLPPLLFPHNMHICNPELSLSTSRLAVMAIAMTSVVVTDFITLGTLWAFPTPFGFQLSIFPAMPIGLALLYHAWKDQLEANPEVKTKAVCYVQALMAQMYLLTTYSAYYCAFTLAGKTYQSIVSFVLPILKMIFKNSMRKDLAPVMIVCNIDAFHVMFVSTTIQESEGLTTIIFIMVVDIVQSLVAYYEVVAIVRQVNQFAKESRVTDKHDSKSHGSRRASSLTMSRLGSLLKFEYGVIDFANYLIANYPRIRDHPIVALPRHMQNEGQVIGPRLSDVTSFMARVHPRNPHDGRSTQSVSVQPRQDSLRSMNPARQDELSDEEISQVQCVSRMLKMLHMIEFYVLIEYMEVVISMVYSLYVVALMHMPNRVCYKQFSALPDDDVHKPVKNLAVYTMLELASFVVFLLAIDQQLQHMSSLQQLAFVLQREWKIVVPTLISVAVLVVQFSFEHNGFDFTFRFAWLRHT